jgi:hypothetical protein
MVEDLGAALRRVPAPDTVVLAKGPRFMRWERVADAIALPSQDAPAPAAPGGAS